MAKKIDKGVFLTDTQPAIISSAAIVGGKEGKGPLGKHFDKIVDDSHFGEKTWEKAETKLQLEAVSSAIRKAGITKEELDVIFSGECYFIPHTFSNYIATNN